MATCAAGSCSSCKINKRSGAENFLFMARTRKHTHDLLLPGPDGWTRWMSWLILRKIVVSGFLVMLLLMSIHVYLPIFFDISLLN
jgi:hypothetical protein